MPFRFTDHCTDDLTSIDDETSERNSLCSRTHIGYKMFLQNWIQEISLQILEESKSDKTKIQVTVKYRVQFFPGDHCVRPQELVICSRLDGERKEQKG